MLKKCLRFRSRRNAKVIRRRTTSQTSELRKDEPHPVPPFAAIPQLGANTFQFRILRVNEPLQLERISVKLFHSHSTKINIKTPPSPIPAMPRRRSQTRFPSRRTRLSRA